MLLWGMSDIADNSSDDWSFSYYKLQMLAYSLALIVCNGFNFCIAGQAMH